MLILCLTSCSDSIDNIFDSKKNDPSETVMMDDWYFFRPGKWGENEDGVIEGYGPFKINPLTKRSIDLCVDPLCFGENCPFYNCYFSQISGNYLFYTVGYVGSYKDLPSSSVSLRVYNLISGTVRELAEYYDSVGFSTFAVDNYIYYYVNTLNETGSSSYILYRADGKIGEILEIPPPVDTSNDRGIAGESIRIFAIYDDKLYWERSKFTNREYYKTDLDGQNAEMIDYGDKYLSIQNVNTKIVDGYAYYLTHATYTPGISGYEEYIWMHDMLLYKLPLDGGEEPELIAKNIISFFPHGDKIYFTTTEDVIEKPIKSDGFWVKNVSNAVSWNLNGGRVYVMNSDGTNKQLICETKYDFLRNLQTGGINAGIYGAKTIDGVDYLLMQFYEVKDGYYNEVAGEYLSGKVYIVSEDLLLVNASTGEYTVVKPPM